MKKLLVIAFCIMSFCANAQKDFKWEKIDSVAKTKNQIYSLTKQYIADTWKSAKNAIQNDDKDAGTIIVKGIESFRFSQGLGKYEYNYGYSATFKMKEGKYKITLDNVYCESAYFTNTGESIVKVEPFDNPYDCPKSGTLRNPGPDRIKLTVMMGDLKTKLQNIINNYPDYLKKEIKNDEW